MTTKSLFLKNDKVHIGLDVDKKSYVFTVRTGKESAKAKKIPAEPINLINYINKHCEGKTVICAYEAGPTGFDLYDSLKKNNISCKVVSPLSIPKAGNEKTKTNNIDSRKIAEYLELDKLTGIRVPEGIYRELRHFVKIRHEYAKKSTSTKQKIKALLLHESLHRFIKEDNKGWSKRYINELKSLEIGGAVRYRLDSLIRDLEYVREQLLEIHKKIKGFCENEPEIGRYMGHLRSIPGIGFITAVTVLGSIGDPKALKNERELGSFVGLVPWENSTGDKESKGSITRMGNKNLRWILTEAAWTAIKKDTQLSQFFNRIKKRNHPKIASKKAIVAVARKMTHIIYRVLKDERNYVCY